MHYLGFDIGGSRVKSVLIRERSVIKSEVDDSPRTIGGLLDLLKLKTDLFESAIGGKRVRGIGISLPGPLDLRREKVLRAPNMGFLNNQPIKELLTQKLKRPVKIEHDVHCFLLAEKAIGLAQNMKSVFYLTLGTGLGGAFMTHGKIFIGSHGASGEVGHTVFGFTTGDRRPTTKFIEFEDLASNKFILKHLRTDALPAFQRAKTGERKVQILFGELGENLGIGIANIINSFDPEAVILAGGLTGARKFIEPGMRRAIKKFVLSPLAQKTKIIFSRLGFFGGALGAALLFQKD